MAPTGKLLFISGKGGVGKTTVAAALGLQAATTGLRTLIVETAADGRLASLFDAAHEGNGVYPLRPRLDAVRVSPRQLVEDYFRSLLRIPFLSRRLFESSSFNALTAAAPGITEFLLLEQLRTWIEPTRLRRARYDLVVIDGPATGHAVKLLGAPRNLLAMVPVGPLAASANALRALLEDAGRSRALLISLAEEFSVRETAETQTAIEGFGVSLARPVVNLVFPRRFSGDHVRQIEAVPEPVDDGIAAARFAIVRRREAERHVRTLRRQTGRTPVVLPQIAAERVGAEEIKPLARTLGRTVLADFAGA